MISGKGNTYRNNVILHSGSGGIHLSGNYVVNVEGNYIFDSNINTLTMHNEGAIIFSNEIAEARVFNNVVDGCLSCIGAITGTDGSQLIVTNNVFKNFRKNGIEGYIGSGKLRHITIANNRFTAIGAAEDDTWMAKYQYTALIERGTSVNQGIELKTGGGQLFENIIINNNEFVDCGCYFKGLRNVSFNNNVLFLMYNFTNNVPSSIIYFINSTGAAQGNVIESNTPDKQVCFYLADEQKVSITCNAYKLTGCLLTNKEDSLLLNNYAI